MNAINWRLPIWTAVGTGLIVLPIALSSPDLGEIAYVCLVLPVISVVLIVLSVRSAGHRRHERVSMLVVYWAISAILVANYGAIRDVARWTLRSSAYKAQMRMRPAPDSGQLQHIEWDGWGFVGAGETTAFLVFDPHDSLANTTDAAPPVKARGLPCEVVRVRRLERQWYAVVFYTDTYWGQGGCK